MRAPQHTFHIVADTSYSRGGGRKRLIMIMGVQRSGTTALFEALAAAQGVTARHESDNDEIYSDWFLRPEPEIRSLLATLPGTILLKPVRESELRSPRSLVHEYADYDLRIIWLYRDPVNVFDSYVRQRWAPDDPWSATGFAAMWRKRNAEALADAPSLGDRLIFVRYEDLADNPDMVSRLGEMLDLRVRTGFRADSALGRKNQPDLVRLILDWNTEEIRHRLDEQRSTPLSATPSVRVWPSAIASIAEYRDAFRAADRTALHSQWQQAGALRFDAASGVFVAVGYGISRQILFRSRPLRGVPSLDLDHSVLGDLEHFFATRRCAMAERMSATIDSWLEDIPVGKFVELKEQLSALAIQCASIWLGVSRERVASLLGMMREMYFPNAHGSAPFAPAAHQTALLTSGLFAELCGAGLLEHGNMWGFLGDTVTRLMAMPAVLCSALVTIVATPEILETARNNPALIPGIFSEAIRLMPMWFSVRRRMNEPLRIGDFDIPEDATVEVILASANRDPSVFEEPDKLWPERPSSPALLMDNDKAAFTRLHDDASGGNRHLLFDVAGMTLQKILSDPLAMEFRTVPSTALLPMPSGDLLQLPANCLCKRDGSLRRR